MLMRLSSSLHPLLKWEGSHLIGNGPLEEETKFMLRDFDMLIIADGVLHRKQQRDGQEVYQLILPKE